jgi:hypothetical protein
MLRLLINNEKDITAKNEVLIQKRINQVLEGYFNQQVNGGYWQGKNIPTFEIIPVL